MCPWISTDITDRRFEDPGMWTYLERPMEFTEEIMGPEVNANELLGAVERAKNAIQNRIEGLKAQRIQVDEELAALGETAVKTPERKRKRGRPLGSRNRTPRVAEIAPEIQQAVAMPEEAATGSDPKEPR